MTHTIIDIDAAVTEFHDTFGLPIRLGPFEDEGREWGIPSGGSERSMRRSLLREECGEYLDAETANDIVGIADALGDMVYVIYGTALTYGIDLNAVITEIHRANMSKLGEDGHPIYRGDGKVLKGPNYIPPDIEAVMWG